MQAKLTVENNRKIIICLPMFCMLVLMAVFSTQLMALKIAFALLLIVEMVLSTVIMDLPTNINRGVFCWMIIFLFNSALSIAVGMLYGNPDAGYSLNKDLIEPVLFFVMIIFISEKEYGSLLKMLKALLVIICIYNLTYFGVVNGLIPFLQQEWFIGMYPNYGGFSIGFIKYHSNNITWLVFLLPMTITTFFLDEERRKLSDLIVIGMGLLNAFFTMRSGFLIAIVATPVLIVLFSKMTNISYNKQQARIVFAGCIMLFMVVAAVSPRVRHLIIGAFSKVLLSLTTTRNSVDSGGYIRMQQIYDLLRTWLEKPLFGWGANANAKNVIRSDTPGAYEMQYFAMLMQRGVIGLGLLIAQIGWLYTRCMKCIRRNDKYSISTLGLLVGYSAVLIANATNPYIGSFDRLIIIFIPLLAYNAIANYYEEDS